ncbi:DUF7139 domain-containing protein [Archaeoglobus veneficus]|uniref:Cell division protein A N-terminal domain-containing protein n=1 Tax=Archaeoglobus veneficus (strain DSM 11195 / SNP6) TaxID=693661 RepID=F2KPS2_ARCVS|nr:hypothetical protein [Archaeoglobus veneficus]AEA47600.1 hypothetical protein Arcve_1600 [Archaeoglobus veneficus SNP6]
MRKKDYYTPSLLFAIGVCLLFIGLLLIGLFRLNRRSEPFEVELTFTIVGLAVPLALYGINAMYGFRRYKPATLAGFAATISAVLLFIVLYPENWYYPQVIYVAVLYALGLVLFFSSSFAEAVMRIIEGTKTIRTTYTERKKLEKKIDTDIDYEEAKIIVPKFEDSALDLKIVEPKADIKVGKVLQERRGRVVKIKDTVPEANELIKVSTGKLRIKKAEVNDVNEASKILKMLEEEKLKKEDKKKFKLFGG